MPDISPVLFCCHRLDCMNSKLQSTSVKDSVFIKHSFIPAVSMTDVSRGQQAGGKEEGARKGNLKNVAYVGQSQPVIIS